jgi:putative ABC transport system ATP-binding protein
MSSETVVKIKGLYKSFDLGENKVKALNGVDLSIQSTGFVIIYGPSGCGKSTLLNVITGLEEPTSGEVEVRDTKIYTLEDDERAQFRADKYGVVSQTPHWVNALNVWENVAIRLFCREQPFPMLRDEPSLCCRR